MKRGSLKFFADESGATSIEYGVIAVGVALATITVVNGFGSKLNTKFASINSSLKQSSVRSQGGFITEVHDDSYSVWRADVVVDEPAGEGRAPQSGKVKLGQLPK